MQEGQGGFPRTKSGNDVLRTRPHGSRRPSWALGKVGPDARDSLPELENAGEAYLWPVAVRKAEAEAIGKVAK